MEFFRSRKIKKESEILEALVKLKNQETKMWEWVSQDDDKRKLVIESGQRFREILLDIIRFIDLAERESKNNSKIFGGIKEEAKPFINKIKEIYELVKIQVKRYRDEIKSQNNIPSVENLKSILNHEKEHGAEFSKLSTLLTEAIILGEELGAIDKSLFQDNGENLTYNEGFNQYVNNSGIAKFGLPKDIFNARIENEELYEFPFWTSASIAYSVVKNEVKLVLSRDKKINKLLDYELTRARKDFLIAIDSCDYDLIPEVNDVHIIPWNDTDTHLKIKKIITQGVENFEKRYKYPNFKVYILKVGSCNTPIWHPVFIYDENRGEPCNVTGFEDIDKYLGHFLILK